MKERGFSAASAYRYGFNGKEKDGEVRGNNNSIEFGDRGIYDPRLGRFKSIDPESNLYPWQTPYAYHRNSPIASIDYMGRGDEPKEPVRGSVSVKKGDNLWNISKKLLGDGASGSNIQAKVNELMQINNLKSDELQVGQNLFTETEGEYKSKLRSYFETFPTPTDNPNLKNKLISGSNIDKDGNFFFNAGSYNQLVDASVSGAEVVNLNGNMVNSLKTSIHWFTSGDDESFYGAIAKEFVASGQTDYFKKGLVRFGPESKIAATFTGGTWIMRNAYAKVWCSYNSNGTIKIEVRVYDYFNVTPQENDKGDVYNGIAKPLNWLHKASGANTNMQTRASWSVGGN